MIRIHVEFEGHVQVHPADYNSVATMKDDVRKAITDALAGLGTSISVGITEAGLVGERP